jgi:hypothetical protein
MALRLSLVALVAGASRKVSGAPVADPNWKIVGTIR